ncbi:diacylglycerol O-acyltransferase [Mycolicibacterium insubricum]|jgi:WS/DGAT/MGAT family acyltransferase|uniref:Diacylglycerol O-acyltransferase n=1 Tax=Mycolicibacterium insubricum TaxID=444597 RepID=A0A1X0D8T8_9MYCO|nr:wax ester/triacylglycerol synthase family O-acyltransferase [Mycolicibacterium insubricum]MCB9441247.1 wax ester/triacylglycerol synthase family O-acyltransferase [Mycolicibacterium sp.]MCV7082764.1 wax ester/triacylglycerol synthase family O-acyltransferase [Mycolicibacterium insubricum]ORA68150.1 diacylglycerol O-acyltransferase [Mycolicibacterium insubricum]BBZ67776.1 diacylglycerol O-acyltransferase [Mycolicibacterium insubricum]
MPGYQRLSGLDASFLYLENTSQPLHVCSILELDTTSIPGGYTFDGLLATLAERVRAMPEFRMKLSDSFLNIDHPVWVEDPEFAVDHHVHRIGLPAPGGREELAEMVGHFASLPLDRSRPLWEMLVVENIDGTDARAGGPLAVVTKVHHAAVDGVTGANLMSQLCSTEPDAPAPEPVEAPGGAGALVIAARGFARFATRPVNLATRVLPDTVGTVVDTVRRAVNGAAMASPFNAPKTAFNATVTPRRNVAFARLDLDDVKTVKNHFDVKVNDVVMVLVAGVLRQYLLNRGELPEQQLVAMVPVSVHGRSDRPGRNKVSGMFTGLHSDIADPAERLRAIAAASAVAKEHSSAIPASLLQDWSQFAAPAVFGVAMRVYASSRLTEARPVHNLVVSNVPGPQESLYFLGAEVSAMYPLGPLFHGSGLNITVMSLSGQLDVGIISCPDLLPDLWDMADGFATELAALVAATRD